MTLTGWRKFVEAENHYIIKIVLFRNHLKEFLKPNMLDSIQNLASFLSFFCVKLGLCSVIATSSFPFPICLCLALNPHLHFLFLQQPKKAFACSSFALYFASFCTTLNC